MRKHERDEPKDCRSPEKHPTHVCKLLKRGEMEALDRLARDATHACNKCGGRARGAEHLCQPRAL